MAGTADGRDVQFNVTYLVWCFDYIEKKIFGFTLSSNLSFPLLNTGSFHLSVQFVSFRFQFYFCY